MTALLFTSSVSPLSIPNSDEEFWERFHGLLERRPTRGKFETVAEVKREMFFLCREPLRRELLRARKDIRASTRVIAEDEYGAVMATFNEAINLQVYGESILPGRASTPIQELVRFIIEYQDQRTIVVMNEPMDAYTVVA